MRIFIACIPLLVFSACIGPFAGKKAAPWLSGPPVLNAHFASEEAAAHLVWDQVPAAGFLHYEIQRSEGGDFAAIDQVKSVSDTSFVDLGLLANTSYRYRVLSFFGEKKTVHELASTSVEGSFHRQVNSWELAEGFLPTRLAVSRGGTVFVVGVGSGLVERFDRAGNPLGGLVYTREALACMETSTLDGPALALDEEDHLYVVYNLWREGQRSEAFWSKFGPDSRLLWTRPLTGLFARHIVINDDEIFIESISKLQQFDHAGERQIQYAIPALLVSSLRFWQGHFAALIEPLTLLEGDWQAPRLVVYEDAQRGSASQVIGRDPKSHQDRGSGLLRRPTDFVIDEASARAFVVNAGQDRIEVFRQGHYLTRWGAEGGEAGQFRFAGQVEVVADMATGEKAVRAVVAGGIARDGEGFVYVADTFNNRIQKFQP
jgi:hypothetical protein